MSVAAPSRRSGERAHLREVPRPLATSRLWPAALVGVCVVGALYHWLQSLGHVTPAVFTDELLFSELARSFAAGDAFVVRDEPLFFPGILPALLQAPAWLAGSTALAYSLAKALNTLVMCSAALPAYWLAQRLVRPLYALIVAAATLAGGGMLYHGYLTSESAAYPLFLLAIAVCVGALTTPSRGRDLIALAVLAVAVAARAQFVVLPLAFGLAIVLVGRPVRRHAVALVGIAAAGLVGAAVGASSLGFYEGARTLDYPLGQTLRWSGWTAALLPFAAGLLVTPAAVLGLILALRRPRSAAERAFAVLTALLVVLMPLQAGLIAAGVAHKPFERYVFYLLPLVFLAFFVYAERGVPGRKLLGAVALLFAALALGYPFASLALDPFSFDSPTLSAVETLARWTSQGDAAALAAAAAVLAGFVAVALSRRPALLGSLSVALALLVGVAAYSADRGMTRRTLSSLAPTRPDWLERSGLRQADVLILPGASLHAGWVLESWNRNVARTFHLGDVPTDPLPFTEVGLRRDGSVASVDGTPLESRYLAVGDAGTQVEVVGRRLARPTTGLSLFRIDGRLRLRSYAEGVYRDRWARSVVDYRVWPTAGAAGRFRVTLSLPTGRRPRRVEVEAGPVRREGTLRPGGSVTFTVPASGKPPPHLSIRIDRADLVDAGSTRPRLIAGRLERLGFEAVEGSRN